jgi:phosphate transport system substrate-binding protein
MSLPSRWGLSFAPLFAGLLAGLAGGCNRAPATDTLLMAGSATMQWYMQPVAEAFMKKHPNVKIVNEEGGSTAALIALRRGAIEIAMADRDLAADEDDLEVANYMVARDGLAIVVNRANPVSSISSQNLSLVYDGTITSWKGLGGADARIAVVVRDVLGSMGKRSGTRKSFGDLVLAGDEPRGDAKRTRTGAEMLEAVKRDPLAIGYIMLREMSSEVKALEVDGVPMSRATMLSGRYPLARSYYLVVQRPTPTAEKVVEFTLGKEGQDILREGGLIAVF